MLQKSNVFIEIKPRLGIGSSGAACWFGYVFNECLTCLINRIMNAKQLSLYNQIRSETKKQKDEYLKNNPSYRFTDLEKEMDF